MELVQLDQYYGEIAARGVELLAVSVDPPETSAALKERLQSDFTFLCDERGALLDALGIRHRGGRADGGDIAFPTTILVDADGIVRWTYQSETYRQRDRPEDVFRALDQLGPGGRARS
ncbi:MAG: redoxin domain-containing protein [Myxococcota bacterium]